MTNKTTNNETKTTLNVYTTYVKTLFENGYVKKSLDDFGIISLENVIKNPIDFKNCVFLDVLDDCFVQAVKELNAHNTAKIEALTVVERAENAMKLDIFKTYNAKQIAEYNSARKFLIDSDAIKQELEKKLDQLENAVDSITKALGSDYDNMMKICSSGKEFLHFMLFKGLASGDLSEIAPQFEDVLKRACTYTSYKAIDHSNDDEKQVEETGKALYKEYKNTVDTLFNNYNMKDDSSAILCKRSINMNCTEYNNLALLISGLELKIDSKGKFKLEATKYKKFQKTIIKVLILKKQNVKLTLA